MYTGLAFALSLAAAAALQPAPFTQPAPQPAPPAPLTEPPVGMTPAADLLGFGNADERMTVPVTIGTGGPYHYIVDTGAQRTVISRELAGSLRLTPVPYVHFTSRSGQGMAYSFVIPAIIVGSIGGT